MSTLTRTATSTRPAERRRRPLPRYRPTGAPRTTTRSPLGVVVETPAPAAPVAPPPSDHPTTCEVCAHTRRFERRVGALVRRGLVLAACAALAALTASPTTDPGQQSAPRAATTGPVEQVATRDEAPRSAPAWCTPQLLPGPGCPPSAESHSADGKPSVLVERPGTSAP